MGNCLSGDSGKYDVSEVEALKKQLADKDQEITTLKQKAGAAAGTTPPASYAAAAGKGTAAASGGGQEAAALKQQVESLQKQLAAASKGGGGAGLVDAIFFPDAKLPCRNARKPGGCRRPHCDFSHEATSLTKFLDYLQSAKKTLDICVFTITCDDISDAVIELHHKGVKVRIITDNDQTATTGSDIGRFREAGIEVRQDSAPTHMHNKVAIMDGHLLLTGSFNWTRQAVLGNQENVVVLENAALVAAFSREFEKLWQQFRP